jgi:pyrroloquinoline quinone biosynthesis protein B
VTDETTGRSLFYAPGVGEADDELLRWMQESDCVMVDGTFFTDDELGAQGISEKRARDMGHLPQSGEHGMLRILESLTNTRRVLIHINNTNPILDEESDARRSVEGAGVEVAYDGMEVLL